jgi:hypothetical protein
MEFLMIIPPASSAIGEARHLERPLSNRHIQLIAIGGAIGAGLGELLLSNLHYKSSSDLAAGQRIWPAMRCSAPT